MLINKIRLLALQNVYFHILLWVELGQTAWENDEQNAVKAGKLGEVTENLLQLTSAGKVGKDREQKTEVKVLRKYPVCFSIMQEELTRIEYLFLF